MYEQIFMNNKNKKSKFYFPGFLLLPYLPLWKTYGLEKSEAYLLSMEGENISDVQAQQLFWKSNTKKAPLT